MKRCPFGTPVLWALLLSAPLALGASIKDERATWFEMNLRGDDVRVADARFNSGFQSFYHGPTWLLNALSNPVASPNRVQFTCDRSGDRVYEAAYVGTLREQSAMNFFGDVRTYAGSIATTSVLVPNATTAVREWANTTPTFFSASAWIGGVGPGPTDIAAFGSAGAGPKNPIFGDSFLLGGLSFLPGAYSYIFGQSGDSILFGSSGISNAATNTQTFPVGMSVRPNVSQTWTNNGWLLVLDALVNLNSGSVDTRTLTIAGSGNTFFNGLVVNSVPGSTGILVKTGTGTLTLSAANTYNGGTSVEQGTLLVRNGTGSGTGSGPVTVSNFGTFLAGGTTGGTGGISGPVQVNGGAALSPGTAGNGTGTTAILHTGNLTLAPFSNLAIDLNGATLGTGYDQVAVTGLVDVTGSFLQLTLGMSFTPSGQTFVILSNDGSDPVTGVFAFANLPPGYVIDYFFDDSNGSLIGGNDIALVPVPEPGTWIGGAAAGLFVIGYRFLGRRRLRLKTLKR